MTSPLEISFVKHYKARLVQAGFVFESQVKIPGARFVYDFRLTRGRRKILVEIDGHGMGHSSVASKARDAVKGNHAVFSGYLFFRLTTKHFKTYKKERVPAPYADEWLDRILEL